MEYTLLKLQAMHYLKQVFSFVWVKGLFAFIYALMIPHQYILQGFALLFVLDFCTGVWVAAKSHNVSSSGMRRGVAKLIIYFLAVLTVAITERVTIGTTWMTDVAIGLLVATEAVSVLENLMVLGLPVPMSGILMRIIHEKAKSYGYNIGSLEPAQSMSAIKDLVDILSDIPKIRNSRLRICMHIWVSRWHAFASMLDSNMVSGNAGLAFERLRNLQNQLIRDTRFDLTRASVSEEDQEVFIGHWNHALFKGLVWVTRDACLNASSNHADKVTTIQNAVAMMIFRLLKEIRNLDAETETENDSLGSMHSRTLEQMTNSGAHRVLRGLPDESSGRNRGTEHPDFGLTPPPSTRRAIEGDLGFETTPPPVSKHSQPPPDLDKPLPNPKDSDGSDPGCTPPVKV